MEWKSNNKLAKRTQKFGDILFNIRAEVLLPKNFLSNDNGRTKKKLPATWNYWQKVLCQGIF